MRVKGVEAEEDKGNDTSTGERMSVCRDAPAWPVPFKSVPSPPSPDSAFASPALPRPLLALPCLGLC